MDRPTSQKRIKRTYESCTRCELVVAVLNDGRISPHRNLENDNWCEGAHRPDPKDDLRRSSFDEQKHRELFCPESFSQLP